MEENSKRKTRKGAGRKPKTDPAVHRYVVRLNSEENGHFEIRFQKSVEKPCDFDPFGQTGLSPFGYNMIDPLKSWCWGSILFYPFKISRFS